MEPDLTLEHQLCFALYAASRAVTSTYRPALEPLGLTYPQYLVLLVLWESDGSTVSDLGRRLHLDSGTLSPLLRRMESGGLLERHRDSPDGRLVTVHLTDAGRALRDHAEEVQRCLWSLSTLSPAEALSLRDLARRLVAEPAPTP
ncbi:MAG TPA: MarR family transcriptional regulator [Nocardioides sp.]|uniref:MarR family winged helix-turn-helix transcriptional regulator n=1 Tax=Nocardioides sp. TaxID=35761 RepID=UPI002C60972D|nr:MarR family transcriptional regulator [Nocardioides sp.]HQR26977.1 MarR family transcriptional regulator [Nocardioides sp.]